MPRGLEAVDLRDEAVRVLRRAVEHVQMHNAYAALRTLETEGKHWWDEAQHVPAVVVFDNVDRLRTAGGL